MSAEVDVVERGRALLLAGTEELAEIAHVQDHLARLQAIEARAHLRRLVAVGAQRYGRDDLIHLALLPHAVFASERSQGNSQRPSSANTMSIPSPMIPIIMIAA